MKGAYTWKPIDHYAAADPDVNYADLHVGQEFKAGPYLVDEAGILDFARQWDPQPFHVDPVAARDLQWQGLIASGWHTCAIAMKLAVQAVLGGSKSCGSPGLEYVRWPTPVRPGDALSMKILVLELRHSRTQEYGVVRWQWSLRNQRDEIVLDTITTSLFGIPDASSQGTR